MDDRGAVELMAKVQCFAETLFGAESTQIERGGDDAFSHFRCAIFTRWHEYELQATGGLVTLCAQTLDSRDEQSTPIVEVETTGERSMATMRACISALEALSELREQKNTAGLQMLQRALCAALGVPVVRRI